MSVFKYLKDVDREYLRDFKIFKIITPWGALQYQMDTGVRLTLPKTGAFGENTISKKGVTG